MKINLETDLMLERIIDISPELAWKAWTDPKQVPKWFTPAPWKTTDCSIDLRPGGIFHTVMLSPEGNTFPCDGIYLEVVENRKLVWTDALSSNFRPSEKPFMTAVVSLEPHAQGTLYRAIALHKDAEDRKKHEAMGFLQGWGIALDQLIAHVKQTL